MIIEEMTDRECRTILARTSIARLACAVNNQPYIVPIHIDYYDVSLYGFATLGKKIEWMRQNPLVCLEIEELVSHKQWATVVVFGEFEELPDTIGNEYHRSVAQALFQRHPGWWEPSSVPLSGHHVRPPILFRILISQVTGRRAVTRPLGPSHDRAGGPAGQGANRARAATERLRRLLGRR